MNRKNYTTREINKNFIIKVNGYINGKYKSIAVGVHGLLELLGGSMERLQKMVARAFKSGADKFVAKVYGVAKVTFYSK